MRLNNIAQSSLTVKSKVVTNPAFHIQTPISGNLFNNPNTKFMTQQHVKQPAIIASHHLNNPSNDLKIRNDQLNGSSDNLTENLHLPNNGNLNTEINQLNEQRNRYHPHRRRTYQPQKNYNNQRPLTEQNKSNINDDDTYDPSLIDETNSKDRLKLSKSEITSSLNNLALINKNLKKKESGALKLSTNFSNTAPPLYSTQKISGLQSRSNVNINKFKSIQFNILSQSKSVKKQKIEKKNETTIKIAILSNWGNEKSISCSEIDILGSNHFPVTVNKIYVEPINHSSTRIMKLINRDMIKNEKKDMWYAKWPPTPPLQKISLIFKVNTISSEVDSMRFWPTSIDKTANLKSVEIYIDNDPVFKGDLPRDFGQVISLKPVLSESDSDRSSEYEYEYEIDNANEGEVNNELSIGGNFKVDFGYSNKKKSEISHNYIKKRIRRKKSKANEDDETSLDINFISDSPNKDYKDKDLSKIRRKKEKLRIKKMKEALNQIRSSKKRLSSQVKGDDYGIFPNLPIQNIEIRCFDSYESPDYFGYSWIRIFDSDGEPIDVRSSASIIEKNCGRECPPASVLFHEDDDNDDITHFDLWRAEIPKCDISNHDYISQGLNSGNVLVHFTDLTLVSAIVIYTFRHPKDMNIPDISAKRVHIYVENRQVWAGRLKHSLIPENDHHAKQDDCATVIFLTAEPEAQSNVLSKCFPSIYT